MCRWQDDRGLFVTIIHPSHSGFWLSQCSRSLQWRNGLTFSTFKNKGEQQHGEISFLTNLSEGSLNRLESLDEMRDMIHKGRLIRGLLCCCPVVLLVTLALIKDSLPEAVLRCLCRKVLTTTQTWTCRFGWPWWRSTARRRSTWTGTWLWSVTRRAAHVYGVS